MRKTPHMLKHGLDRWCSMCLSVGRWPRTVMWSAVHKTCQTGPLLSRRDSRSDLQASCDRSDLPCRWPLVHFSPIWIPGLQDPWLFSFSSSKSLLHPVALRSRKPVAHPVARAKLREPVEKVWKGTLRLREKGIKNASDRITQRCFTKQIHPNPFPPRAPSPPLQAFPL